ncbi:hypothetical protein PSm6_01060 [Pseudomonas solani]|uniref:Uncharacterized protein n=1 Tax=Pseudomonas solani TaxID=2731552 RepID=A0AAU7Y0P3_9PSED|nr:hypothetical protein [Pseudomonas solani]MDN4147858.1 hypothetical protein [Pseudomonas tohonis]BCD83699.1 hypothetical protein PSm6_01060 [Pseudomonas solani]
MRKALAVLLLISPAVFAESATPHHDCKRPDVPAQFRDEAHRDQFTRDVDSYNKCITAFVTEQNEAVRKHREAALKATEEWNAFANSMK